MQRISAAILTLVIACSVCGAEVNRVAIARVKSGELEEARASWWGFDAKDSTQALQAAINSGVKRLIVDRMPGPWVVTPIKLVSDQEIVFEKGCVVLAKRGEFKGRGDTLLKASFKKNLSLIGYGATLRMWRDDYAKPPYDKGEWRHAISIHSCTNIKIHGLTILESGGDGIYLGKSRKGVTNKGVHIKNVICDKNYRQGISIITAEDLLIEDTTMNRTGGTNPMAGIDFEPNHPDERLVNCVVRNCVMEGNTNYGMVIYVPNLKATSAPMSIRVENCVMRGGHRLPLSFTTGNKPADAVKGLVEFVNCTFSGGKQYGMQIRQKPAAGCKLRFINCRVDKVGGDAASGAPIHFSTRFGDSQDFGGIEFRNCTVEESVARPVIKYQDMTGELDLVDITGAFKVIRGARAQPFRVTPKWLAGLASGRRFERIPAYDMRGMRYVPVSTDLSARALALRPFSLRRKGTFAIHATRGDDVKFELIQLRVGKYGGRARKVSVVTPSGTKIPVGEAPFLKSAQLGFKAPETGLYRITVSVAANRVQMLSANRPAAASIEVGRLWLISSVGDFYFYVPAGTKRFGVKIAGEGAREAVGAAIFDPTGRKVWERPTITTAEQFVGRPTIAQTGKAWKLRLQKPVGATMEDNYITLQGIPPFLSSNPNTLFKAAKGE